MDIDMAPAVGEGGGNKGTGAFSTPQQQQQQHVWTTASTAYEALALSRAALQAQTQTQTQTHTGTPALNRASLSALLATLHTAVPAYADHVHLPPRSPAQSADKEKDREQRHRHERLIHERSRLHASRVQMVHTLAHGFGMPLQGSRQQEQPQPASERAGAGARTERQGVLPRELTEQLYAALVELHPVRPAPASAQAAAIVAAAAAPPAPLPPASSPSAELKLDPATGAGAELDLSAPALHQGPTPRNSASLATLALNTLSNIVTSPARSLFAFEVFAEHFDLDRGSTTSGGANNEAAGAAGAGAVTSPSVAVSPAVAPPETADGGRAVSVIMVGGKVLVVDIELGVKDWATAASASGPDDGGAGSSSTRLAPHQNLPAWAQQKGTLAWIPTVHVKITFANDPAADAAAQGTSGAVQGSRAAASVRSSSDSEMLAAQLQRHLAVLAQLLLLGFPLHPEIDGDENDEGQQSAKAEDGDVYMLDVTQDARASASASAPAPEPSNVNSAQNAQNRHPSTASSTSAALCNALARRERPDREVDPALRLVHADLYGPEYYLLARYHLQAFVKVLARLAQLDHERFERSAAAGVGF
ncbi:hypothetical protein OC834_003664 [Tilletia horrida]|nr:hypothetical protein OC834_003664 [Tilletia horrida]